MTLPFEQAAMNVDAFEEKRKSVDSAYVSGSAILDRARVTHTNPGAYLQAAEQFKIAADLCAEIEKEAPGYRFQVHTLGLYYRYEENKCRGDFFYNSRDTIPAKEHFIVALANIEEALRYFATNESRMNAEVRDDLSPRVNLWKPNPDRIRAKVIGCEARKAWDENRFMDARDGYASIARLFEAQLAAFPDVRSSEHRIALGNYIGALGVRLF